MNVRRAVLVSMLLIGGPILLSAPVLSHGSHTITKGYVGVFPFGDVTDPNHRFGVVFDGHDTANATITINDDLNVNGRTAGYYEFWGPEPGHGDHNHEHDEVKKEDGFCGSTTVSVPPNATYVEVHGGGAIGAALDCGVGDQPAIATMGEITVKWHN